jgi:hypothetical protein
MGALSGSPLAAADGIPGQPFALSCSVPDPFTEESATELIDPLCPATFFPRPATSVPCPL